MHHGRRALSLVLSLALPVLAAPAWAQIQRATVSGGELAGVTGEGVSSFTVQVGKRANLLRLRENPLTSIEAYDTLVTVILDGQTLERSELAANQATERR